MPHLRGSYQLKKLIQNKPASRILQINQQYTEGRQPDLELQARIEYNTKADRSNR